MDRCKKENSRTARKKGRREVGDQFQIARLGVFAAAILGRADPRRPLREMRSRPARDERFAARIAGGGEIRADGHRRVSARRDRRVGELRLSELR